MACAHPDIDTYAPNKSVRCNFKAKVHLIVVLEALFVLACLRKSDSCYSIVCLILLQKIEYRKAVFLGGRECSAPPDPFASLPQSSRVHHHTQLEI